MANPNFFFNQNERLRSGWRFLVFCGATLVALIMFLLFVQFALAFVLPRGAYRWFFASNWVFVLQAISGLVVGLTVGWLCARVMEDLPARSLGWARHHRWSIDLVKGALVGALSVVFAVAVGAAAGGTSFSFAPNWSFDSVGFTLFSAAVIFALGAASEETLFRGYALQTLMRSQPFWLAVIPSSILFAMIHLRNPQVVPGFTALNTTLAGIWLAIAYWKTRSLWFPLGVHWGWNWTSGPLLGLPVSGIESIAPNPLFRASDSGPAWLTGGSYGVEGGLACTIALVLSSVFIWRTTFVSATPEMKVFTQKQMSDVRYQMSARKAAVVCQPSDVSQKSSP